MILQLCIQSTISGDHQYMNYQFKYQQWPSASQYTLHYMSMQLQRNKPNHDRHKSAYCTDKHVANKWKLNMLRRKQSLLTIMSSRFWSWNHTIQLQNIQQCCDDNASPQWNYREHFRQHQRFSTRIRIFHRNLLPISARN